MTAQQFVGLAARLSAIWLAISSFQAVGIAQALQQQGNQDGQWAPYFIAGLFLCGAIVLWLFPMFIAHALIPRTKFDEQLRLPAEQTVVVACVILGLFIIVFRALPPIATYLSIAAFWVANGQTISTMGVDRHTDGLVGFIQLIIGIAMIIKPHALAAKIPISTNAR